MRTREEIANDIMVSFAGMAAEEIFFSTVTTGPSSDLENATRRAAAYVGLYGMDKKLTSLAVNVDPMKGGSPVQAVLSNKDGAEAVESMLQRLHTATLALVKSNRSAIEVVAAALIDKGEIVGDEIHELLESATSQRAVRTLDTEDEIADYIDSKVQR